MDKVELLKQLGNIIKFNRKKLNLSQEELGFKCNLTRNQISQFERGLHDIRFTTLIKLINVLQLNCDELFYKAHKNTNI